MKIYLYPTTEDERIVLLNILAELKIEFDFDIMYCMAYTLDNETKTIDGMYQDDIDSAKRMGWFMNLSTDKDKIIRMYKNEVLMRFNSGKMQWSLMDHKSMESMVDVLMFGAKKYAPNNWKKPVDNPMEIWDSLYRHVIGVQEGIGGTGSPYDKDSKLNHIGHAMCNLMFLAHHLIVEGEQERVNPEE